MFHLVEEELNNISPDLINLYGVMMSINDLVYWIMPDQNNYDDGTKWSKYSW